MFVLASVIASYACFEPVVMASYTYFPRCPIVQLPRINLWCAVINMELRQFLLLLCSIAISVVWVVCRNEEWAWMLQDFLGVLFRCGKLIIISDLTLFYDSYIVMR
jgi:hypothetical protein